MPEITDQQWFHLHGRDSYHLVASTAADGQMLKSLCGKYEKASEATGPVPSLPGNVATCENCLRLDARRRGKAE